MEIRVTDPTWHLICGIAAVWEARKKKKQTTTTQNKTKEKNNTENSRVLKSHNATIKLLLNI